MPVKPDPDKQARAEIADIPPNAVLAALDKAVASESFGKAERPARFLRHLVETTLRGESHFLKESVLGTDVFDRPATWDPRLDPVVRQEAARLRKRLAKYHENGGAGAEIRIDLPVGTYVPVFRRRPDELEAVPVEPSPVEQTPAKRPRTWLYAAAGMLCVASAGIAWRGLYPRESSPSIAVLPFVNLTADPANQYFSDGLTDEITDSLARVKTLRVIARSSALQFRGKTVDVREVGRLLNVTNVLEGSVERSGDRIKIIAHLERVSDGSLQWSNTYERKASDLFAVQTELAAGIAGGLKLATTVPPAKHVPNAEAHELYMKGRYDLQQITAASVTQAELDFQSAIGKDPEYAAAYVGLASAKYDRGIAGGSSYQTELELKDVETLLQQSLQLDPDLPSAHAQLATLAMQYDRDWGRAERELQLAVAGPPSSVAEGQYAFFLLYHRRFAEADRHLSQMAELDPFSAQTQSNLALARDLEGRFTEARKISQDAAAGNPRMLWTQQIIGLTYVEEGRPELALPIFRQMKQRFTPAAVSEAMAQAKAGQKEEALRLIDPYLRKFPNPGITAEWLALVYAFMGDEPNALKWLQRSADLHESQVLSLAIDPAFASIRSAADFQALERRIGLN